MTAEEQARAAFDHYVNGLREASGNPTDLAAVVNSMLYQRIASHPSGTYYAIVYHKDPPPMLVSATVGTLRVIRDFNPSYDAHVAKIDEALASTDDQALAPFVHKGKAAVVLPYPFDYQSVPAQPKLPRIPPLFPQRYLHAADAEHTWAEVAALALELGVDPRDERTGRRLSKHMLIDRINRTFNDLRRDAMARLDEDEIVMLRNVAWTNPLSSHACRLGTTEGGPTMDQVRAEAVRNGVAPRKRNGTPKSISLLCEEVRRARTANRLIELLQRGIVTEAEVCANRRARRLVPRGLLTCDVVASVDDDDEEEWE